MSGLDLDVGVTSWNSGLFIGHCLDSLQRTLTGVRCRITVLDNCSVDDSTEQARRRGVEVIVKRCSQADAINALFDRSKSAYTLVVHSDVIMLSDGWFDRCARKCSGDIALVAPEDIGCGPFTRPFGAGKPESSFLFANTKNLRKARSWHRRRHFGLPVPELALDLYRDHVTHALPDRLARAGLRWCAMRVHISPAVREPIYVPSEPPAVWSEELPFLRYGLGNFYSLDGAITHYHNWYDRVLFDGAGSAPSRGRREFPPGYISAYTRRFLDDLVAGNVCLPDMDAERREPRAL